MIKHIIRKIYKNRSKFLVKEANKIAAMAGSAADPELKAYYEGMFAGMDYTATIYGFVDEGAFVKYVPYK